MLALIRLGSFSWYSGSWSRGIIWQGVDLGWLIGHWSCRRYRAKTSKMRPIKTVLAPKPAKKFWWGDYFWVGRGWCKNQIKWFCLCKFEKYFFTNYMSIWCLLDILVWSSCAKVVSIYQQNCLKVNNLWFN